MRQLWRSSLMVSSRMQCSCGVSAPGCALEELAMAADTDAFSCVPISALSSLSAAMKNNVLFMNLENEHKSQIIAEMYRAEIKEGVSAIKQGQDRTCAGTRTSTRCGFSSGGESVGAAAAELFRARSLTCIAMWRIRLTACAHRRAR